MVKILIEKWNGKEDKISADYLSMISSIDNALSGKTKGVINQVGKDFSSIQSSLMPSIFNFKKDKELAFKIQKDIIKFRSALLSLSRAKDDLLKLQARVMKNKE